ncbi:MAG: helix-turn-helix transcriptional regulator [Selenomonas ruminantium]|jgi:transcriptional regulator with XRE-family HTH domain|uniref:Helix-turn-helix transcriptional regulator n=1 Tax=Selenomonas ruminantium TaxID=971 RepID=A0A927ZRW6_SELRU|nr:helix-turn-helix transcriptional regulator [Selenomonas ruminantium]MBE6084731.1 helix-turn-helix transcriptional regulator [Selenomonas ruminantium]
MTIKDLRLANGLTQKELAEIAGVTVICYQHYEYGKRVPDARIAVRIANALHTTVEQLWGGSPTTA